MRTPFLRDADNWLSFFNTHYTVAQLINEQFKIDNGERLTQQPNLLTTAAFPVNPIAGRAEMLLSKLKVKCEENRSFIAESCVSRASETLIEYFEGIEGISEQWTGRKLDPKKDPNSADPKKEIPYFKRLAKLIGQPRHDLMPKEVEWALDHIRLRRNCLVHKNGEANSAFEELARNHGHALTQYWIDQFNLLAKRRSESEREPRLYLDFKSKDPTELSHEGFIDILRIARLSIEHFDKNYCRYIPEEFLVKYCWERFNKNCNNENLPEKRIEKRFKHFCLLEFDWSPPKTDGV